MLGVMRVVSFLGSRPSLRKLNVRLWSTQPIQLEPQINTDLENEVYKPKHHPGRTGLKSIEIPQRIQEAIEVLVDQEQIPQLVEEGGKLDRLLFARKVPLEQKEVYMAKKEIENRLLSDERIQSAFQIETQESNQFAREMLKQEVMKAYYQTNYNWKPMIYDPFKSRAYLFGRAAKEYAAIKQVFNEIIKRDENFKSRSFFDFGAGIGTGTWAASDCWKNSLFEYFLVDQSRDMNDLSELILRDGNEEKNISLKNVFYRQFLPSSDEFKSHLVLSAFTLNDLPNISTRLDVLLTLWKKCDGYIVIIENGSNAGFKLLEEARDFFIQQAEKENSAYLFAPCPHHAPCPRVVKNDGTPCNFIAPYRSLGIERTKSDSKVLFSYVVFKKGERNSDETINWPRMVRPTQVRTRHTRCKLCTHRGLLEEVVVTKAKHSKFTYRCARKSDWGDRLPVVFNNTPNLSSDDNQSD